MANKLPELCQTIWHWKSAEPLPQGGILGTTEYGESCLMIVVNALRQEEYHAKSVRLLRLLLEAAEERGLLRVLLGLQDYIDDRATIFHRVRTPGQLRLLLTFLGRYRRRWFGMGAADCPAVVAKLIEDWSGTPLMINKQLQPKGSPSCQSTPLLSVVGRGSPDSHPRHAVRPEFVLPMVRMLIEAGADPNVQGRRTSIFGPGTALDIAKRRGNDAVADYLEPLTTVEPV